MATYNPVSKKNVKKTMGGAANGAAAGGMVGGPAGAVVGGVAGAVLGDKADVTDISGTKADKRNAKTEKTISTEEQKVQDQLDKRPKYAGITTPDGKLDDQFKVSNPKSNLTGLEGKMSNAKDVTSTGVSTPTKVQAGQDFTNGQQDMSKLRDRAFGTGPSEQAKAQMALADNQSKTNAETLAKQSMSANQTAQNTMAQQGGLSGGARERMATQANRQQMMANQGNANSNLQAKMGISAQDEAQRSQLQQAMPGMSLSYDQYNTGLQRDDRDTQMKAQMYNNDSTMKAQQANQDSALKQANMWGNMADTEAGRQQSADTFNVGNRIGDAQNYNNFNQNNWQTDATMMGANQTANAQARAGKSGGFFQGLFGG